MELFHIILLAIIQGLTEFLPISSSAHLILPSQLFGIPDQGLSFDIAVHVGSLIAVMLYFRVMLINMVIGGYHSLIGKQSTDGNMAWFIVIATIPAGLLGLALNDLVETHLRGIETIATTTLLGAILLWYAVSKPNANASKTLKDMTLALALIIGIAQALAIIPGTSRSGITITMALLLGFTASDSARFSFLLSVPVILSSGLFKALDSGEIIEWQPLIIGATLSAITAWFCIHYFLTFIEKIGMMPFIIYRLILGIVLFAFIA